MIKRIQFYLIELVTKFSLVKLITVIDIIMAKQKTKRPNNPKPKSKKPITVYTVIRTIMIILLLLLLLLLLLGVAAKYWYYYNKYYK